MDKELLLLIGGVGLFLLGMVILTEGLRGLAGDAMRRVLTRFTKTPVTGVVTGALTTAIIQSSSATTVAAVSFVAAGLLTFPQALGIVFGANIGTTVTGWIIAILGFKLHMGQIVLPFVFIGVLLKLFGNVRLGQIGWALAGFSLLFIGIESMQQGMAQYEGIITPSIFPDDTFFGRLQLVAIGAAITLVTQSSSAGVVAALVALSAGSVTFAQAAAMVIGMDIGTTFTAALATIGGSTATRQTGFAHVIYNTMTGILAFILLGPFSGFVDTFISTGGPGSAQISLVAFHTAFNVLGVLLVLPFARPFARLIVKIVPERGPPLLQRLDEHLLSDPASAVDAAIATIRDILVSIIGIMRELLDPKKGVHFDATQIRSVDEALAETYRFVEKIRTDSSQKSVHNRHLATVHALDHLVRLSHRCTQIDRIETLRSESRLHRLSKLLRDTIMPLLEHPVSSLEEGQLERVHSIFLKQRGVYRDRIVEHSARQRMSAHTALERLDSIRWLHRVAYHLWRIEHHLHLAKEAGKEAPDQSDTRKLELDVEED